MVAAPLETQQSDRDDFIQTCLTVLLTEQICKPLRSGHCTPPRTLIRPELCQLHKGTGRLLAFRRTPV